MEATIAALTDQRAEHSRAMNENGVEAARDPKLVE